MFKDYLSLALGNLKHRGLRSWLTMLGIFIGIAAVVSLISLGQGLETAITGQFSTLSTDRLIVQNEGGGFGPPGIGSVKKLNNNDIRIIESVSGVEKIVPRILRTAKVKYNDITRFEFVGSLPQKQDDIDYIYESFSLEFESGKSILASERGKIVVGNDFKENNGFDKDIRAGNLLEIQGEKFEVSGILKKTSSFQFNRAIFMLEGDMNDLFLIKNEFDFIVIQVSNQNKVQEVASEIARKLREDRNEKIGEEDFSVQTPLQAIGTVNTILNIINLIVGGIAAISLLVGGIGITNTMFTSVLERRKEIGTMKAVGARNKDILFIFLVESGFLGLIGGIIGAFIGIGLAFLVSSTANSYFGEDIILVNISWTLLLGAIVFSFIIGIAAGTLPAFQASRLKPMEALRQ
ncbi:ABC transporter permease [Candidatus Pacearchaeota archaeon]|nr:ABC transporter permease [Candidatus Pacearchaeota archaeon]